MMTGYALIDLLYAFLAGGAFAWAANSFAEKNNAGLVFGLIMMTLSIALIATP